MLRSVQVLQLKKTDIQMLKALADMTPNENPSEHNIAQKTVKPKLSTPTVRRRISALVENGYAKYLGRGKQRSKTYRLELKGILYLLFNTDQLKDVDISKIAQTTINELVLKRKMKSMLRLLITKRIEAATLNTIQQIKPRINLDCFNEEHASKTFYEALLENVLNTALNVKDCVGKHEALTTFKALKHDSTINDFLTEYFETTLEYIEKNKVAWETRFQEWHKLLQLWKQNPQ